MRRKPPNIKTKNTSSRRITKITNTTDTNHTVLQPTAANSDQSRAQTLSSMQTTSLCAQSSNHVQSRKPKRRRRRRHNPYPCSVLFHQKVPESAPSSSSVPNSPIREKIPQNSKNSRDPKNPKTTKNQPKNPKKTKNPKNPKKSTKEVQIHGACQNIKHQVNHWKIVNQIIQARFLKQQFVFLQETHRPGQHDEFIDHDQFKKWRIISSGQGGNRKKAGVAVLLSPECIVLDYKHVQNARILAVHVRLFGQELMLVCCYAPDERNTVDKNGEKEHSEAVKASFWDKLEKFIEKVPKQCRRLIGGDFNATIHPTESKGFGPEHPFCCYTNSKETSFNGRKLLDLCACNNLFLENTYFKNKKAVHSWTFQSVNKTKYKRRLDYFLTDRIIHSGTSHCRAHPPLQSLKTDHKKLVIKFKLRRKWFKKQCKKSRKKPLPMPDVRFLTLDENVRQSYQFMLEQLTTGTDFHENLSADERDILINQILMEACDKTVPKSQKSYSAPWMSDEYIKERERVYATRKNRDGLKKLQKLQIKLQNNYYQKRAKEINEAAEAQEVERFFRQSKDLTGALKKTIVKSACTEKQHVEYITSCFKNRKLPLPPELQPGSEFFPAVCAVAAEIDESVPQFEEISEIMSRKFKLGKSAGSDGVFNELLKYSTTCKFFMDQVVSLVQQVWIEEKMPDTWKKAIITLIYKKGKNNEPKNFRPVALIHCVSKIVTKIVRIRADKRYHDVMSDVQFGFKSGCGTIDAIYVFRQIITLKKGPIHCLFLDLRGAFDRLPREHLIAILRIMLGSDKIANLLADIHLETKAVIKTVKLR